MVSVIVITYNRAHLIMDSIYSVLNQTYSDLELIIVDDGSDDDTEEQIQAIRDPRIRYFKFPHTGHLAALKNFAVKQSTGAFIAFNDSDDWWMETKLEKQVDLLSQHPHLGFSITNIITYKAGIVTSPNAYDSCKGIECTNVFHQMSENRFILYNQTLLLRRSCFEKTGGFNENMLFASDYNFNIRLAWYYDAGIIYAPMVWRQLHDNNRSANVSIENYEGFVQTFEYLYQHKMISQKHLHKTKSHAYLNIGHHFKQQRNLPAARHHYRQSLKYNLLQPHCYWLLLKTLGA